MLSEFRYTKEILKVQTVRWLGTNMSNIFAGPWPSPYITLTSLVFMTF